MIWVEEGANLKDANAKTPSVGKSSFTFMFKLIVIIIDITTKITKNNSKIYFGE